MGSWRRTGILTVSADVGRDVGPEARLDVDSATYAAAQARLWTLAELPDRVAALLAGNYEGQTSGRIGELPTGRTIRWYTTIGLVDRPVTTRGRAVLYGPRHVLQLAAIKKLQSEGRSLAEVQQRLVGASDVDLADLVGAPPPAATPVTASAATFASVAAQDAPAPAKFWKQSASRRPLAHLSAPPASPVRSTPLAAPTWGEAVIGPSAVDRPDGAARADGAGSAGIGVAGEGAAADDDDEAGLGGGGADRTGDAAAAAVATAAIVPAVLLGDSVTLVLAGASRTPGADELAAIAAAAAPLLDLLAGLGLATATRPPATG